MFKKYYDVKENAVIYMGRTSDIKAMHKSMARASRKYATDLIPLFSETKFSATRITYGIVIDDDNLFYPISSDTFTAMLLDGDLVKVKEED